MTTLWRWLLRLSGLAVALFLLAVAGAWWASQPAHPDAFYAANVPPSARPGTLLRSEPLTRGIPPEARAWRILYVTTRLDEKPAVASGLVLVPAKPSDTAHPVIAWAHGTTGIADGCAPTLMPSPLENLPALNEALREGWALVGTDYAGLGTQGTHAYLIGDDAARSVLDAVRAARAVPGLRLSDNTVAWGFSQGGHAALWAGIRARSYAPDVMLRGVAAFAPGADLKSLVTSAAGTIFGKIVSSYLVTSYASLFPDVQLADYMSRGTRLLAGDIATRCLDGRKTLFSVIEARLMPANSMFTRDPTSGPLGARLGQNTPLAPIAAPLLIAQGSADDLVNAELQRRYVEARCAAGQAVDYRVYPGLGHVELVAPASPLGPDAVEWTRQRFAGAPAASSCKL